MAHRIEVRLKPGLTDPLGRKMETRIREHLGLGPCRVATLDVYTIDGDLPADLLDAYAKGPLSDPIVQEAVIDDSAARGMDFSWLVEVSYRPGVTDNIGRTATEALALLMERPLAQVPRVFSGKQYLLQPADAHAWTLDQVRQVAEGLLGNQLIQSFQILRKQDLPAEGGLEPRPPKVTDRARIQVERIDLNRPDAALEALSRERVLALSLDEMKVIAAYFKDPKVTEIRRRHGLDERITDVELECLAQTWSEHCKHKIFNATIHYEQEDGSKRTIESLFDSAIKETTRRVRKRLGEGDYCKSVFKDNAGVIAFTEDWNLVFKVETHNSPSALDPYGGALTGIVGVNRDPFGTGLGSKLVFNTDIFCLAPPNHRDNLPPRLLQPMRVLEGVREGVEHGGNKSGIPTVNGAVVFDERYLGKPLVYCGTGGIMPAEINGRPSHVKQARPGDLVVMVGGRIGKDGIHGATFSSEELHEGSPATAVQIGDPITQKRMFDMLLVARDRGLYDSITDNGAGGLSSSVGEMATQSGGADIDLAKAPLKYSSLQPWEILISEAQERMTLSVPPDKLGELTALARRYQVEITVLGTFNDSGFFTVRHDGEVVALLDMEFLHEGLTAMELWAKARPITTKDPDITSEADPGRCLLEMLGRLNIASKEYWVRQYDHEVGGGSVVKPLMGPKQDGPSDAAVIRPLLDRPEAVVVSNGLVPRYSDIDAGAMAAASVDEAVRNALATGADPDRLAALDNFCWPDPVASDKNPEGPFKLAQLVDAAEALRDTCIAYDLPLISGKDSMKNDYRAGDVTISVPPTLLVSVVGRIQDASRAVTTDAKAAGHLVYVLGRTRWELGGSEYLARLGHLGSSVPRVRPDEFRPAYQALHRAMERGLVASCHDCSDGGLATALAETAMAGRLGMDLDLSAVPAEGNLPDEVLCYSESAGRFVITVPQEARKEFEDILSGQALGLMGRVTDTDRFVLRSQNGTIWLDLSIDQLLEAWKQPLDL